MEASNYVTAVLWMVAMKSRDFWDIKSSPLKSQILLSMHVTAHIRLLSVHIHHIYLLISVFCLMIFVLCWDSCIVKMYVCIYRVQKVFLRCPTPRLHCFLSSHWPSLRFLSFMAFFIPSIQFYFGLPRALFCFGIHFNAVLGSLSSAIL